MRLRQRQTGALLLLSLVFMVIAAFGMLAAMASLSGASGTAQAAAHMGYQAFFAAESGLNYGIYQLEQDNTTSLPSAAQTITGYPVSGGCQVTVKVSAPVYPPAASSITWTVSSTATCADATQPAARTLSAAVTANPTCAKNRTYPNGTCKTQMLAPNYAVTIGSWTFD